MAIYEIRVDHADATEGERIAREVRAELGQDIIAPQVSDAYYTDGDPSQADRLAKEFLTNPVTQTYRIGPRKVWDDGPTEVTDRAGIINTEIDTIATGAARHGIGIANMALGTEVRFDASVTADQVTQIAGAVLVNKEIQEVRREAPTSLTPESTRRPTEIIAIGTMTDADLTALSKERRLGLNLAEMKAAQQESQRKYDGQLPEGGIRFLGAFWSDHCRHKTFNAELVSRDKKEVSLFSRIKNGARQFYEQQGVIQAFDGNSAVFKFFTDKHGKPWAINIKGETHNHPTMLEAYGGVATGEGGLLRDIIQTGKGARVMATMISAGIGAKRLTREMIPKGLQTPMQILKRGVKAVSDYGNRVGVPTVGAEYHHHPGYRGKPMFLGVSIGLLPESGATEDKPKAGDYVFAVGGKTGQDGIGGATGSSVASNTETLANISEVQVPNAFEETKMKDAIWEAGQKGLIRAMTDCGAGGIGLAAGELGEDIGVEIDLSLLPLKAGDFDAWMKAISESQERGVIAVAPEHIEEFEAIFAKHNSGATAIGTFGLGGDTPRYVIRHGDEVVSDWEYDFLKNGLPTLTLEANYTPPEIQERPAQVGNISDALLQVLAHDDICSVEPIIRQFDHEVQGMNVLNPFTGVHMDAPNYASVLAPFIDEEFGVVFAQSAHPNLTDLDPDKGTAWVVNDLFARIVAVGGNPERVPINNNYISPRPTPQAMGAMKISVDRLMTKLAGFKTAPFTGKDSCSSEHTDEHGNLIKGPYNLSLAGISPIPDIRQTTSADIKSTNSTLVLVGNLDTDSMGGSILYDTFDGASSQVPEADFNMPDLEYYQKVHRLVQPGQVLACGVVGKGGLAVTLSKMLFGGDCGADVVIDDAAPPENILFNETAGCFVVEIPAGADVQTLLGDLPHQVLGKTTPAKDLTVRRRSSNEEVVKQSIDELKTAWKTPNEEIFA